jgi:hypothetical protein
MRVPNETLCYKDDTLQKIDGQIIVVKGIIPMPMGKFIKTKTFQFKFLVYKSSMVFRATTSPSVSEWV